MGYTTQFSGSIELSRPLTLAEAKQWLAEWVKPKGHRAEPNPGGYLQWVPSTDLRHVVWDEGEKFYNYTEWMRWVVARLSEIGVECNGTLLWSGEDAGDVGRIVVADGAVTEERFDKSAGSPHAPMTLRRLGEIALARIEEA